MKTIHKTTDKHENPIIEKRYSLPQKAGVQFYKRISIRKCKSVKVTSVHDIRVVFSNSEKEAIFRLKSGHYQSISDESFVFPLDGLSIEMSIFADDDSLNERYFVVDFISER